MSRVRILDHNQMDLWDNFVFSHEHGSIYHTSMWRKLIEDAYGHSPVYLIIQGNNGDISAGLPLFIVKSNIMGNRLSSLPCAQSCNPLVSNQQQFEQLMHFVLAIREKERLGYFELKTDGRFRFGSDILGKPLNAYSTYTLDIDNAVEAVKSTFHRSSIQRAIKRSHKLGMKLVVGDSHHDVKLFYLLYLRLRKKYGLLPQPFKFFSTMWQIMQKNDHIDVMHAEYQGRIISSILLLKYKGTITYEYGASVFDMRHHRASQFLLWEAIKRSISQGYERFDFGRTADDNKGLSQFKSRWGTIREPLSYYYAPERRGFSTIRQNSSVKNLMHYTLRYIPDYLCRLTGSLLYKNLV